MRGEEAGIGPFGALVAFAGAMFAAMNLERLGVISQAELDMLASVAGVIFGLGVFAAGVLVTAAVVVEVIRS